MRATLSRRILRPLMVNDYTTVTEATGCRASLEQMGRLYVRYAYGAGFCAGKDVLEVACGSGMGLGYLARKAKRVVGGDYTDYLLRGARHHYGERIPLVRLDAHFLPFGDRSFDTVILYEAIYYLERPERFLDECQRVLREGGVLLICTVNREWHDFHPSPFSVRYFSASELADLLGRHGFEVDLLGDCPAMVRSARDRIISFLKRAAVRLHLIPRTMKGKELLKRLFFGTLIPLPPEISDGMAEYIPPSPFPNDQPVSHFKVIFAVGRLAPL